MRFQKAVLVLLGLQFITQDVCSTILTTTLITGLVGGFLIGRMSLGTFMDLLAANRTALPSLNLASVIPLIPRDEAKTNALPNQVKDDEHILNIPPSLDNRIRDRFIHQLALMDPLNCLPKIFCEVSADPVGVAMDFDHGSVIAVERPAITKDELFEYESKLQLQPQSSRKNGSSNGDTEQDDTASGSDESSESEEDSFEQYRKEQEYKLEMKALNEMVDENEDPATYLYILQDKKRQKAERNKKKGTAARHGIVLNGYTRPPLFLNRRMGGDPPPTRPSPQIPPHMTTEPSLDDMFADDPFFNDDTTPARQLNVVGRRGKISLTDSTSENQMKKYKIAFLIAEKYRSPSMCAVAFPTCPYQTKTILSVVNKIQSGQLPLENYNQKTENENIEQFKNTLLAIERLNKVALQAKKKGQPIDVESITAVALSPSVKLGADASQKIVSDFQEVASKIGKTKLKRKKHSSKRKGEQESERRNYNLVRFYKKAQIQWMPNRQNSTFAYSRNSTAKNHDDELHYDFNDTPTFSQTYVQMFNTSTLKNRRRSTPRPTVPSKLPVTTKPIKKFDATSEDDEQDESDREDAVNALISQTV